MSRGHHWKSSYTPQYDERLEAEIVALDELQPLLEDTDRATVVEPLELWDYTMVATGMDAEYLCGEAVWRRLKQYPEDYEFHDAVVATTPDNDTAYTLAINGSRIIGEQKARLPATRIFGRLDREGSAETVLIEEYGFPLETR